MFNEKRFFTARATKGCVAAFGSSVDWSLLDNSKGAVG
jgi:hypothetical protein